MELKFDGKHRIGGSSCFQQSLFSGMLNICHGHSSKAGEICRPLRILSPIRVHFILIFLLLGTLSLIMNLLFWTDTNSMFTFSDITSCSDVTDLGDLMRACSSLNPQVQLTLFGKNIIFLLPSLAGQLKAGEMPALNGGISISQATLFIERTCISRLVYFS
jgi:hypothetical protein